MPDADVSLLADYAADIITAGVGSLATIESVYEFTEDMGEGEGKKIYTFPIRYVNEQPETRSEDGYILRVGIIVLERYVDPGTSIKAVPTQWVKDNVAFVEQRVFVLFANPRYLHTIGNYEYWALEAEVATVYDHDKLRQHQQFWSELVISFRTVRKPVNLFVDANVLSVIRTGQFNCTVELDQPVNVLGLPLWKLNGTFTMNSITPIDATHYDCFFIHEIINGSTVVIPTNDPELRTYTAGYVKGGVYPVSVPATYTGSSSLVHSGGSLVTHATNPTVPVLLSASVTTRHQVTLTFNQNVICGSGGTEGFTLQFLQNGGVIDTVNYSGTQIFINLVSDNTSEILIGDQFITLDYLPGNVSNEAGNRFLGAFTGYSVTNSLTPEPERTIVTITDDGGMALVETQSDHGLIDGESIGIIDTSEIQYNMDHDGPYTVTVISSTTFQISKAYIGNSTGGYWEYRN